MGFAGIAKFAESEVTGLIIKKTKATRTVDASVANFRGISWTQITKNMNQCLACLNAFFGGERVRKHVQETF